MTIYQIVCRYLKENGNSRWDKLLIEVMDKTSLDKVRASNGLCDALEIGKKEGTLLVGALEGESFVLPTLEIDKVQIPADNPDDWRIEIWPFDKAPERYRNMCNVGGDEDWIALVPAKLAGSWLPFLEQNKFGNDVDQIPMNDGTGRMLLVSTHA